MPTSRLSETDVEVVDFVLGSFELAVPTVVSMDDSPLPRRRSLLLEMVSVETGDWTIEYRVSLQ